MPNTTAAAQTTQNVALLTYQISELEAQAEWDAGKLASLYDFRGKEILQALKNGVPAATLSEITGLGA